MKRAFLAAAVMAALFLPAAAKEASPEAKLLLYCSAAFAMAGEEAEKKGDAAGAKAMQDAVAAMGAHGKMLLTTQGFSDAEIASLAKAAVDQAFDELQNNKPRSHSHAQCYEAYKK